MADAQIIALDNRTVIAADGDDAEAFLQGLISNDMDRVGLGRAIYAALLTPQGKFLHDFFVAKIGGGIVLDCESSRAADLLKRLGMFKLRAKVELSET
ncbi:MAG: folate-binding protein, partial [Rhodospirillales bacterium]|nr:folate-binding protein [Rhodospirillales bacterium]